MKPEAQKSAVSVVSLFLLMVGALLSVASSPPHLPVPDYAMGLICGSCVAATWEVSDGSFEMVPSWHQEDRVTSLIGDPFSAVGTATTSPYAHEYAENENIAGDCVTIRYLGKIDESVSVSLSVDMDDDGLMDASMELNPADWDFQRIVWALPGVLSATQFQLDKVGSGEASFEHLLLGYCYNDEVPDCAGVPGGVSTLDECGVCDADPANDC